MFRVLFFLLFLSLIPGCRILKGLPYPPSYDQECEPSDPTYLSWALDTTDLSGPGEIPSDPKEALDKAIEVIASKGIRIVEKKEIGNKKFDRFSTTLPRNIYVRVGFWEEDPITQAVTLWHEIVHVRQWERLGSAEMALRWTVYSEGRWALETVAYRESFRAQKLFGASEEALRKAAPGVSERFYESYGLAGMPKACMVKITSEILVADL